MTAPVKVSAEQMVKQAKTETANKQAEPPLTPVKDWTGLVTVSSVVIGAGLGYLVATKMKKNKILGLAIGAAVIGVSGRFAYTKFSLKK